MNVIAILAGTVLLVATALDAVGTLVTTIRRTGKWWPTNVFYRYSSRFWFGLTRILQREDRRRQLLFVYGPVSILGMLVVWATLLIVGWALLWWALRDHIPGIDHFVSAIYFSGVTFFTVGYGDIVPDSPGARTLVVVEAFSGVLTTALVISYLATLYSAYSRRETKLSTLDDLRGADTTAIGLIESYVIAGDLGPLCDELGEWEDWCAEVVESHAAYPALLVFRSRQPGRSWLAGLMVVADTAVLLRASVDPLTRTEPIRLHRRATELVGRMMTIHTAVTHAREHDPLDRATFEADYDRLAALGLPLRSRDEAWARLQPLRATYVADLHSLFRTMLASPMFTNYAHPPSTNITETPI